MTSIVFYRDHPLTPDTHMQIGDLYKKDGTLPKQHTWRKIDRQLFWGYKKKTEKNGNSIFINVGDKQITLKEVVANYFKLKSFCDLTDGFFDVNKGSENSIILDALERSMSPKVREHIIEADDKLRNVIKQAKRGAIINAQPFEGLAWKSDLTSSYSTICASDRKFPLGKPIWLDIDELKYDELERPAFYLAKITGHHRMFRGKIDVFTWHTNIDIKMALDLDLDVVLAIGENTCKFNKYASGKLIFGNYVNILFKIKQQGGNDGEQAKFLLNKLTGLLGKKRYKVYGKYGDLPLDRQPPDINHDSICPDDEGNHIVTIEGDFVIRLLPFYPFIIAYGRARMIDLFLEHNCIDDVIQIHTDGWILPYPVEWKTTVSPRELGGIKLEYQGWLKVYNVNKVRDANDEKL